MIQGFKKVLCGVVARRRVRAQDASRQIIGQTSPLQFTGAVGRDLCNGVSIVPRETNIVRSRQHPAVLWTRSSSALHQSHDCAAAAARRNHRYASRHRVLWGLRTASYSKDIGTSEERLLSRDALAPMPGNT